MGWQSVTEIARLNMSSGNRAELVRKIRAGKNGRAFGSGMDRAIPGFIPGKGEKEDNWGPKFSSCIGPAKSTTDDMWDATMRLLSLSCARAYLHVMEFNFSDDHPAAGGIWEVWFVFDTALLSHYLEDYHKEYSFCEEIPKDMYRVLRAAHEYDDGLGGRWETIVIKHTVV